MNYHNEIVNFLALPENISHAFEIAEHIENVKEKTTNDFWISLYQKMEEYLKTNHKYWKLSVAGKKYTDQYAGYTLTWETEAVHPKLYLAFGCWQEYQGGKAWLYWHTLWRPYQFTSDPCIITPAINQIKNYSIEKKYKVDPKWSVGWNWLDFFTAHKDFCIRYVNERDAIIDNVHQCVVQKFEEFKPFIEKANQEIKSEIEKDNSSIKNAFTLVAGN